MAWYNLRSGGRDFIHQENKRIIDNLIANADFLATNLALEAAKSRMNDARIAMESEDDPVKKARLRAVANQYAREVLAIQDAWESEVKASYRRGRRMILLVWLVFLAVISLFFPVNLIALALFGLWWYRHYVVLRADYQMSSDNVQTGSNDQENSAGPELAAASEPLAAGADALTPEKLAQIERINQAIEALDQAQSDWLAGLRQEEAAAKSAGQSQWTMSESARGTAQTLVQQHQALLENMAQIADSADISEAYQAHTEAKQLIQQYLDDGFVINLLEE